MAPHIAVLGASGLIGHAVACDLVRRGFAVRGYARRFTPAQRAVLTDHAVERPLVALDGKSLSFLLADADIVVNCIGMLQGKESDAVHRVFVTRLAALCAANPQKLLIHFSIPGKEESDRTTFATTKRAAERVIEESGAPYAILHPGFVVAPEAYGGSALMRALAVLPFALPPREARAVFAAVSMADICGTVARTVQSWRADDAGWRTHWDLMEEHPGSVGDMIDAYRRRMGGPEPILTLPDWILSLGVIVGDMVAWLGWKPPVRSTAIREMRRGVAGDPRSWISQTGIAPQSRDAMLAALPAGIQEKWFARLYFLKPLMLIALVLFWCLSGLIALTVAFEPARAILLNHGFSLASAHALTVASSLVDIAVGLAIAVRRTAQVGLIAGIGLSVIYMVSAAFLTPEMWIEPLGALVKTGPAIILMLVCLAVLDDR